MTDLSPAHRKAGRIAALTIIVFASVYAVLGSQIEYSFSSDPIGPRGFPIGLGVLLAALGVWYYLDTGACEDWPDRRGAQAAALFLGLSVAMMLAMPYIGFIIAMAILLTGVARLFGASWPMAFANGIGQAVLWWLLFGPLLGSHLPKGPFGF